MKTTTNYGIRVLATGFVVLVFFAIPLYWGRYFAELLLCARMPEEATRVVFSPSGILPEEIENDPNADQHSVASAQMDFAPLIHTLGFTEYLVSRIPGGDRSDVFYYARDGAWMYFDRSAGQIVFRDTYWQKRDSGGNVERQTAVYYAGPEGVSMTPGEVLGQFHDPVHVTGASLHHIVYDRKLHRFFAIDGETMTVQAGLQLTDAMVRRPLVVGSPPHYEGLSLGWEPPKKRVVREAQDEDSPPRYEYHWTIRFSTSSSYWSRYLPVIDASGQIVLLDQRTLELVPAKGTLPAPKTLYGEGSRRPSQLLACRAPAICIGPEHEYAGLLAAVLSRQGTSAAMSIFDKNGNQVAHLDTRGTPYSDRHDPREQRTWISSARAALFDVPWAPTLTILKYLLENVHPPVLTIASFCLANRIEAGASHRTLFLVPNSFAAMHRDQTQQSIVAQFLGALWIMLPAIGLAVFLAWRVVRDAAAVGLSRNARSLWLLGTLAFGLPAYITYRMTRPASGLVTCAACGKMRRADMERCHLCGGAWDMPELAAPAWRVLDGGAPASEPPAESEKPLDAGEQKTDSSVESM
ncbi:MAG TPA: hypothetical protein PLU87_04230 [Sedimentisphaerales bacterium]|nr:hypothetical protein [Sedimentisphaerales bacterium]HRS10196.1 hypothetical protein [Sedimentisphaerales bacterium]HRV46902.1 hypothetical protein [Sedimentisphaerales bacterium]